jgi:hypothetical protein
MYFNQKYFELVVRILIVFPDEGLVLWVLTGLSKPAIWLEVTP